jgi:hypothetical protein
MIKMVNQMPDTDAMFNLDKFQIRLAERWVAMFGASAAFQAAAKAGEAETFGHESRRLWWLGVLSYIETLPALEFIDG